MYPGLEPGAWLNAAGLAEQMLAEHMLRPSPGYGLSERVLARKHLSSEVGTLVASRGMARTRCTDPAI